MTFDYCPCCRVIALPHTTDCTFATDCPAECDQFDAVAELRAEVERLRLTDEEREVLSHFALLFSRLRVVPERLNSTKERDLDIVWGLLERTK